MAKQPAKKEEEKDAVRVVARNRKAFHQYEILDRYEAGIVLRGSEVKSIREGKVQISESYAKIKNGEAWLLGMDVSLYPQAGPHNNHEPRWPRKLLLHKREIRKLEGKTRERGLTVVPLALYFKNGLAKLELGLARGKQEFDKRAAIRKRESDRDLRRRMMK
jgi:SsrA-binding protein